MSFKGSELLMRSVLHSPLRRLTALLCAAALCLAFAPPAAAAEAPEAEYAGKMEYSDDHVFRFAVAAPAEAVAYEEYRVACYREASAKYTDEEIAR